MYTTNPASYTKNKRFYISAHSLPKVGSAAQAVELVVVRARVGLRVRRLGSEKSVTGPLFGLLPLTIPESDQGI